METTTFRHIKLVREGKKEYLAQSVDNPSTAASFLSKKIGRSMQESFVALYLDSQFVPIGWREVFRGAVNACVVHPREVFCPAVHLMASAVVVAHNHPSGNLVPSKEDVEMTRRLKSAGGLLGIEVVDHLIIAEEKFFSFREGGVL